LLDTAGPDFEENRTSLSADLTAALYSKGVRLEPPPRGNAASAEGAVRVLLTAGSLDESAELLLPIAINMIQVLSSSQLFKSQIDFFSGASWHMRAGGDAHARLTVVLSERSFCT
jgi:hypothetical protein